MKKLYFLKVVILCLLPGLWAIGGCRKNDLIVKTPRLMCEETVYNFGEATNTEVIEHIFVLKNIGALKNPPGKVALPMHYW